jgi:predicted XRE-type DNA-binding protein
MSAQRTLKRQVMMAIREWIQDNHLTQAQAGERLGLHQQQVSQIMLLESRNSVGRLLDAWETSGGLYTFKVYRDTQMLSELKP